MTKPVITVENLSKAYRIGLKEEIPDTLVTAMSGLMRAPFRKFRDLRKLNTFGHAGGEEEDLYWALKDVSFEVQEGEVLGVIGRNGAGKSTLLKILSRITEPTSGRAVIRGRVSSLLEVGTGFHPELSGRENVYLNGTILGMTKREIDRKFDEIVDFSGVEKFLDTPIKRYSSGMKVRLAFAVAAHLEPEILIIDEVLAVGDAEFQKKCMGKMQDVAKGGRTVLFVSHNMTAVDALCDRAMMLNQGSAAFLGSTADAITRYLSHVDHSGPGRDVSSLPRAAGHSPVIRSVMIVDRSGAPVAAVKTCSGISVNIKYRTSGVLADPGFGIVLETSFGSRVCQVHTRSACGDLGDLPAEGEIVCQLETLPLIPGTYYVSISCGSRRETVDQVEQVASFEVIAADIFGTGRLPRAEYGPLVMRSSWSFSGAQCTGRAALERSSNVENPVTVRSIGG